MRCRSAVFLTALALVAPVIGAEPAALVRKFPFPFSHAITFASDADAELAWHGRAIHRVINEEIGLPIASSIWVHGFGKGEAIPSGDSYLFQGMSQLNRMPSGVGSHPVFALLIREWHKGNYDHFHGWQDDSTFQIRNVLKLPVPMKGAVTPVELPPRNALVDFPGYRRPYQHLRIYFDKPPPDDLYLRIADEKGRSAIVGREFVRAGRNVQLEAGEGKYITDIAFDVPPDLGMPLAASDMDVYALHRLELVAPSCAKGCDAKVYRVDRDNFSRQTALAQLPFLEAWNIRPAMSADHGGYTMAQNFAPPRYTYAYERAGNVFGDPQMAAEMEFLANDRTGYAYLTDIMRRIGVESITPYGSRRADSKNSPDNKYSYLSPMPPLESFYPGLYNLPRARLAFNDDDLPSARQFRDMLIKREPLLAQLDTDEFYCKKTCHSAQGAHIGLLIAIGLLRVNAGLEAEHLWYTHFSTGDTDWNRTQEQPLKPSAVKWLRILADHHYNFSGRLDARQRVWVPPPGVFARYRIARAGIGGNITVDPSTSAVVITPWKDRVTGKTKPDLRAGMRDLHGITVHVPRAATATLVVGGRPSHSFTRNPPDQTGRESITIVGDSAPTVIADETPLRDSGSVSVAGVRFTDASASRPDAARGATYISVTSVGQGGGWLSFKPEELALWNTTHLQFAVRKRGSARLAIEIVLKDGGMIALQERPGQGHGSSSPANAGAWWQVDPIPADGAWHYHTLATDQLAWRKSAGENAPDSSARWLRPPLPIGRIAEVRVRLEDAQAGARVDLDNFVALRPSSNGVSTDAGKLVAGRVTFADGNPIPGVAVRARMHGGKVISTVSDRDGYYFLYGAPNNRLLRIEAEIGGRICTPGRGALVEVRRDDAEIDIDASRCLKPVPASRITSTWR